MNALLLLPLLSLGMQTKGKVTVNVNAQPNQVVTGEGRFRVSVTANNPVTQVEFYVGGDLRDTDTSTPYEFKIDSLSESEGPLKLTFRAYTTEGERGEKTITVVVDNQLSKGAAFHIDRANGFLSEGKWNEAITAGRLALKIDSRSVPARVVLARANLGLGVLDNAQKYAEDAVAEAPNDRGALAVLAVVNLRRGFNTVNAAGGNRTETLNVIAGALKSGVEAQKKAADQALETVGQPTDANLIAYADAAIAARRYGLATQALRPAFEKDDRRLDVVNRLAYSLMREGLYRDAFDALNRTAKFTPLNAYGLTLLSIVTAELNDPARSDEAMKNASLADPAAPSLRSAQAFLALKFNRKSEERGITYSYNYDRATDTPERAAARGVFQRLATDLGASPAQTAETGYYMSALYNKLEDFNQGQRYFERSVLADPLLYDSFVERGNRALFAAVNLKLEPSELGFQYEAAKSYFNVALAARDDSAEALTGLAVVAAFQNDANAALRWASAAVGANAKYASAQAMLSLANVMAAKATRRQADDLRTKAQSSTVLAAEKADLEAQAREADRKANDFENRSRTALNTAGQLDRRIQGQELPDAKAVWRYFAVAGRRPVISAPK